MQLPCSCYIKPHIKHLCNIAGWLPFNPAVLLTTCCSALQYWRQHGTQPFSIASHMQLFQHCKPHSTHPFNTTSHTPLGPLILYSACRSALQCCSPPVSQPCTLKATWCTTCHSTLHQCRSWHTTCHSTLHPCRPFSFQPFIMARSTSLKQLLLKKLLWMSLIWIQEINSIGQRNLWSTLMWTHWVLCIDSKDSNLPFTDYLMPYILTITFGLHNQKNWCTTLLHQTLLKCNIANICSAPWDTWMNYITT